MKHLITLILFAVLAAEVYSSCTHKPHELPTPIADGGYPADVAKIITGKCTNAGCHNQASYQNAAGLLLDTWEHMFQGSVNGSQVVAYSPKYSPLLYYVNTDSTLGEIAKDLAHLDTPITHDEYLTLYNWIKNGAPDKNGNIPFASAQPDSRQKIYLSLQGCGLLGVIDAKSKLIMRYIPIADAQNQSPHGINTSADGKNVYVPFFNGRSVKKIDTHIDTVVNEVDLGSVAPGGTGQWSVVILSPLDTEMLVSGWISNGCVVAVNTETMQINERKSVDALTGGSSSFPYPHGLATNATFDTFYSTLQTSVIKYSFKSTGEISYTKTIAASGNPHQIQMTPDRTKYFVTCPDPTNPSGNEVRIYDTHTDTLIKVITVGTTPQEMDVSPSKHYIFVTCMEDAANTQPNRLGSVYVIDYNTLEVVKVLYGDFYQPHGITVDEQDGLVFVPSRNVNPSGPPPHHTTGCGGASRPGWYSVYDLNTLLPADNKRYDVPADPYTMATRFK